MDAPWLKYQQQQPNPLQRPIIQEAAPRPAPRNPDQATNDKLENELKRLQIEKERLAAQGPLTPQGKNKIRQDAATKINQIRKLRARIESMDLPNVTGAGLGEWMKYIPGTPARGVAGSLKQIGSAGALSTALEMAKNNGGKNPLTPMSNSDIELLSNMTAALDQGQSYGDLKKQLDSAEAAFGHAYIGAGGNSKSLMDRSRHDGPFPGKRQAKQQPRVINFNDLPE